MTWIQLIPRKKRIRYKRKANRVWHKGKVRLDAEGTAELRLQAFERSGGICECGCRRPVTFEKGEMHHETDHGTRSDVLDRVIFIRKDCHEHITGKLQWTKRPA